MKNPNKTYMYDCWADPVVQLFLPTIELHDVTDCQTQVCFFLKHLIR